MKPRFSVPLAVAALGLAWALVTHSPALSDLLGFTRIESPNAWQVRAILGTWVDDANPAHIVHFEEVPAGYASPEAGIELLEGRYTFTGVFGIPGLSGVWNYESFDPLRLNVVIGSEGHFVAVGFTDRNHARMRLVDGISTAASPDVLDDPATVRFHRGE